MDRRFTLIAAWECNGDEAMELSLAKAIKRALKTAGLLPNEIRADSSTCYERQASVAISLNLDSD